MPTIPFLFTVIVTTFINVDTPTTINIVTITTINTISTSTIYIVIATTITTTTTEYNFSTLTLEWFCDSLGNMEVYIPPNCTGEICYINFDADGVDKLRCL